MQSRVLSCFLIRVVRDELPPGTTIGSLIATFHSVFAPFVVLTVLRWSIVDEVPNLPFERMSKQNGGGCRTYPTASLAGSFLG